MFGATLFATLPFATVGVTTAFGGLIWNDSCPADTLWVDKAIDGDAWDNQDIMVTQWTDSKESVINTRKCQ